MPNWCDNNIEITGPEAEIARFVQNMRGHEASYPDSSSDDEWAAFDDIRKRAQYASPPDTTGDIKEFCMNALVPVPDDIRRFPFDCRQSKKIREELGEPPDLGGYRWQVHNWGSKWDVDAEVTANTDYIFITFSSAWSPPISFVQKVSEDYPKLSFQIEFSEPGADFAGMERYEGGERIDEEIRECECCECEQPQSLCKCWGDTATKLMQMLGR